MSTDTLDSLAVLEEPILPEAEIPTANIQPAAREFADDAWENVANIPVFAEHSTTTKSGRQLTFGREELAILTANCNRRIRDTGDYAGIIVGHTPDPECSHNGHPLPLAGLAGPFRMGLIRQRGGQAKWAILADFHVRREQASVIRDYPRRSAELWLADEIEDMYLDPIALLGGETPRLDMGLLYSARQASDGRQVEKYSACAPSATSVFVPDHEPRKDYSAESSADSDSDPKDSTPPQHERTAMALTPEDLKQIVDALEEQQWVQWVKAQMVGDVPPADVSPAAVPPVDTPPPIDTAPPPADVAPVGAPPPDEALPVKYSRLASQVAELKQTVDTQRGQLDEERARRVNTERYAALADCRRTRLFELEAEYELVKYGRMSDEQFTAHVDRISANYREIPLDTNLPTFDMPAATSPSRPGGAKAKERYGKEVSDKALEIAKRKAMNGEPVSYEEILEQVAVGEAS